MNRSPATANGSTKQDTRDLLSSLITSPGGDVLMVAVEVTRIVERMQAAESRWESALDAHALAPPDAAFPHG